MEERGEGEGGRKRRRGSAAHRRVVPPVLMRAVRRNGSLGKKRERNAAVPEVHEVHVHYT